jgi:hypothetical protein
MTHYLDDRGDSIPIGGFRHFVFLCEKKALSISPNRFFRKVRKQIDLQAEQPSAFARFHESLNQCARTIVPPLPRIGEWALSRQSTRWTRCQRKCDFLYLPKNGGRMLRLLMYEKD